jgi:putative spermidine/putrescine transport system permease protein
VSRERRGLAAALLVAAPVLVGVTYAAAGALGLVGAGAAGLSTARVRRVLAEPTVWESLAFTVWVGATSTLLATAAAVAVATTFRGSRRSDRVARALAVLPLPIPHLVAAVCAVMVLGQSGLVSRLGYAIGVYAGPADAPELVYDPRGLGLILTLAWKEFPFLALVAASLLASRGTALEEVARSLGAGRWAAFARVTWPMLWRGLIPAVVAVFVFVIGSYEAAALLAPSDPLPLPVLTLERYTDAELGRRGDAFALVLVATAVGGLAVVAHEWARSRWASLDT